MKKRKISSNKVEVEEQALLALDEAYQHMKQSVTVSRGGDEEHVHFDILHNTPPKWIETMDRVLYSSIEIQNRIKELGAEISQDYIVNENLGDDEDIIVVGLLRGAVPFMSDLIRKLKVPYKCDYMALSSYEDETESSGTVKMKKDLSMNPKNKHILIVEDIIDSGNTLNWLSNYLTGKQCKSIRVVCLLDKKARRKQKHVKIDHVGFYCEDYFVVGYGMDYQQNYRGLPYIGVLKESVYNPNSTTTTN